MIALFQQKRTLNATASAKWWLSLWLTLIFASLIQAQTVTKPVARTRALAQEVQTAAYPELSGARIEIKTFGSDSDYFQSRFAFGRFFMLRRMRYVIYVNPLVYERGCPEAALRAIIAHELAHVLYYRRRNRLQLFGLTRLASKSFTARFERGADLEAIAHGYGAGLKEYRLWLYRNIPPNKLAEKRRNYFSPEEIDAMLSRPVWDCWRKNIPRGLAEIETGSCAKTRCIASLQRARGLG